MPGPPSKGPPGPGGGIEHQHWACIAEGKSTGDKQKLNQEVMRIPPGEQNIPSNLESKHEYRTESQKSGTHGGVDQTDKERPRGADTAAGDTGEPPAPRSWRDPGAWGSAPVDG